MHELSIAVSMIEAVTEEAERAGAERVSVVHLKLGPLSGVVRDALMFSFEVAAAGTLLEGATLEIEDVPVVVFCEPCQAEKPLPDLYGFRCPDCGTPTSDIRQGRELEITAIEIH